MTVRRHSISSAVHAADEDDQNERVRICERCMDMFGLVCVLGSKILMPGVPKAADNHFWLECRNCGMLYLKHETKVEPELAPIKEASIDDRRAKITGTGADKKKRKGNTRGNNPRLRIKRDDINDPDLIRELKDGAVLLSYSSSEPL